MSNTSSPPLRLELRPSRLLQAALACVALLACVAIVLSALPNVVLLAIAPLWWHAQRQLRAASTAALVFRADGSAAWLDGEHTDTPIEPLRLLERGPLAILTVIHAGRTRRIPTAIDTMHEATRRSLRLWFARHLRPQPATSEPVHG